MIARAICSIIGHKWTEWKYSHDTGIYIRFCTRCGKIEEIDVVLDTGDLVEGVC